MRYNVAGIPLPCLFDREVSPRGKVIYLTLKSFPRDKSDAITAEKMVTAWHSQIAKKSGLNQATIFKALNNLEAAGWITKIYEIGRPNKYILHSKKSPQI